jgi:hypothetical protein
VPGASLLPGAAVKLTATVTETGPGRWTATAEGCRGEGSTEEEALTDLRMAVALLVAPSASPALP